MSHGNIRRQEKLATKRLRDMTWDDYGITKYRYRELKNFCLQYPEKRAKVSYGLNATGANIAIRNGHISRPTESQAVKNSRYSKDILMIENSAREASAVIYPWIIKSVTEDLSYDDIEYDQQLGQIPICKKDFYGLRRKFYSILDKRKK